MSDLTMHYLLIFLQTFSPAFLVLYVAKKMELGSSIVFILVLVMASIIIWVYGFKESEVKEMSQKWHDFTVSNSCGIFEKNEKAGTISWKCADGIIYTKPASILNETK